MGDSNDAVFLGIPTHDGRMDTSAALVASHGSSKTPGRKVYISSRSLSLLAWNFNHLWCDGLNAREEKGIKWFAMLHGDITPDTWWIDTLIEEAEANDADVMSAVVPIKCPEGLTSTAIENPNNPWESLFRLSLKQVNNPLKLPPTFDAASVREFYGLEGPHGTEGTQRLLVNTGCFVARIDRPWAEQVRFTIQDRIYKGPDGQFQSSVIPEDWQFSKDVAALGGKVMATTKVELNHRGIADYKSSGTWGLERDHLCEKNGL